MMRAVVRIVPAREGNPGCKFPDATIDENRLGVPGE
jgi:hypothetical protein